MTRRLYITPEDAAGLAIVALCQHAGDPFSEVEDMVESLNPDALVIAQMLYNRVPESEGLPMHISTTEYLRNWAKTVDTEEYTRRKLNGLVSDLNSIDNVILN